MNRFELVEVKTISVIHSKCPTCGFDNPQSEMLNTCPICETNLIAKTIDATKPFCGMLSLG